MLSPQGCWWRTATGSTSRCSRRGSTSWPARSVSAGPGRAGRPPSSQWLGWFTFSSSLLSLFCLLLVSFVTKVVDAEVTFVWSPDCFLKRPGRTGRAQLLGGAGAHRCPAGSRLVRALPGRCPGAGQSAQAGQPQHRGGAQAGGLLARFPVITAHPVPPGPRGCGALHLSLPLGLWPQDRPTETQLQKSPVGQCQVLL